MNTAPVCCSLGSAALDGNQSSAYGPIVSLWTMSSTNNGGCTIVMLLRDVQVSRQLTEQRVPEEALVHSETTYSYCTVVAPGLYVRALYISPTYANLRDEYR